LHPSVETTTTAAMKVAPNGPNAKEAQTNREMLKQYIK